MDLILEYKGYQASVEYDEEDNIFFGKVIGISDLISFHGESIAEVEKNFKESIEDYLEFCKEVGKAPDEPFEE